jgi:hypothetical protein
MGNNRPPGSESSCSAVSFYTFRTGPYSRHSEFRPAMFGKRCCHPPILSFSAQRSVVFSRQQKMVTESHSALDAVTAALAPEVTAMVLSVCLEVRLWCSCDKMVLREAHCCPSDSIDICAGYVAGVVKRWATILTNIDRIPPLRLYDRRTCDDQTLGPDDRRIPEGE